MKKVSFTEMKNGSKEDYQLLEKYEKDFERKTADRILKSFVFFIPDLKYFIICSLELIINI